MRRSADAKLLDLIAEIQGVLELDEFATTLIRALRDTVPCDWTSLNGVAPDPADYWVRVEPELTQDQIELFAGLSEQNPLIARYRETLDGRVYRFSDVVSRRELHALDLYRRFYGPLGIEHQLAFTLPSRPGHILGIALSRCSEDFTDGERDLLERARPYLIQAYRNVLVFAQLSRSAGPPDEARDRARLTDAGLTEREAEVLRLAALGRSNQELAHELAISARTVQKHLERAFRKLGVSSRGQAAALVWSDQS